VPPPYEFYGAAYSGPVSRGGMIGHCGWGLTVKNLLAFIVIAALAWFAYGKFKSMSEAARYEGVSAVAADQLSNKATTPASPGQFACDGRTHCSQMHSCAEATYFIKHCPNTKMDGNNDGVPCEQQWCN
jgi:hypothetical protein